MKKTFRLGRSVVGAGKSVYIIAEAGSNHDNKLSQALELVDIAARCGADAVKFQLFKAESLYPKNHAVFPLLKSIELPAAWLKPLRARAQSRGIDFLATPFDRPAVDALERVRVPAYKWASSETVNLPLLRYAAKKGRPLLISTGMCDLADVHEAVETARRAGNDKIILLQCSSVYPTPPKLAHLRVMDTLREAFGCPVGYSDHTLGYAAAAAAVARGACVIEKHFTISRGLKGPDHSYALEPDQLKEYVRVIREAEACLGSPEKILLDEERKGGARRETLFASKNLPRGAVFSAGSFEIRRPASGLRPRFLASVVGRKARRAIRKGEPITWESVS